MNVVVLFIASACKFDQFEPVDADDAGPVNYAFAVDVLVTVEEKLGFRVCDEICKSDEPCVNFIIAVVNSARAVVG